MKINLGKNTIGDNKKMSLSLKDYEMSTHDLSFVFRSTMAAKKTINPKSEIYLLGFPNLKPFPVLALSFLNK